MVEPVEPGKSPGQWLRNNLVTLGSAAVLSVYSAGYFRTREAADRFAGESVRRHAAAAAPASAARTTDAAADHAEPGTLRTPSTAVSAPAARAAAPPVHAPHVQTPPVAAPAAPVRPESVPPASVPAAAAPAVAALPLPAPELTTPPVAVKPAAAAPDASPPQPAPAVAAPLPDSVAATTDGSRDSSQLRDGVFHGWGTSRHGDIQAAVEIRNGRIVGAYISQCLTRYSCSWISALPPEVLQRQSAEVDYVSGATQSSNAFYYAVLEALKLAK